MPIVEGIGGCVRPLSTLSTLATHIKKNLDGTVAAKLVCRQLAREMILKTIKAECKGVNEIKQEKNHIKMDSTNSHWHPTNESRHARSTLSWNKCQPG